MKKYIIASALVLLFHSAHAQDRNSREGFFLGFGLGIGGLHINDDDGDSFNKLGGLGGLRIGGGINENILLMGETFSAVTEEDDVTLSTSALNFSVQVFPIQNFYVRPGIGFASAEASGTSGSTTVTVESDAGFSFLTAVGYEFRLGKSFVLSPELDFNYARISDSNFVNYGTTLGLLWYFK